MTLHFEGDEVREYIQMLTLAENNATKVEAIKRIIERTQYAHDAIAAISNVLGVEVKKDDDAA